MFKLINLIAPVRGGATISPSDANDLAQATRGIYVGTAGHIRLTTLEGQVLDYKNVAAGGILSVQAVKVWASGTTATDLLAQW